MVSRWDNPARGRVRLGQVALFVQVGHDVSDGGGAKILAKTARNCPGCNGFARLDVRLHDGMQDREMPILGRGLSIHCSRDNTLPNKDILGPSSQVSKEMGLWRMFQPTLLQ
jgi:hypothetical protein